MFLCCCFFIVRKAGLSPADLASWCFQPCQPQWIIHGLKETFVKRCIVERANKEEIRPEEQSGKAENCQEKLWNGIQLKGP